MDNNTIKTTSLRLTDEDVHQVEEARRILATNKGMKIKVADVLRTALYFFVEQKKAEKKQGNKPTLK